MCRPFPRVWSTFLKKRFGEKAVNFGPVVAMVEKTYDFSVVKMCGGGYFHDAKEGKAWSSPPPSPFPPHTPWKPPLPSHRVFPVRSKSHVIPKENKSSYNLPSLPSSARAIVLFHTTGPCFECPVGEKGLGPDDRGNFKILRWQGMRNPPGRNMSSSFPDLVYYVEMLWDKNTFSKGTPHKQVNTDLFIPKKKPQDPEPSLLTHPPPPLAPCTSEYDASLTYQIQGK